MAWLQKRRLARRTPKRFPAGKRQAASGAVVRLLFSSFENLEPRSRPRAGAPLRASRQRPPMLAVRTEIACRMGDPFGCAAC
jgi:hypothetical protein